MTTIAHRLQDILTKIQAANSSSSHQTKVELLAVSKGQSTYAIRQAYLAGQTQFGENYLQEALKKQKELEDLPIEWHFIGPIQSNKTQLIAQNFAWVHSVDRVKIAQRLNDARCKTQAPLQVCIQVNASFEESKSGADPKDLESLAVDIIKMPQLTLRGLMSIPPPSISFTQQYAQFQRVRECYEGLLQKGFKLDTLSIGMSDD